MSAEAKHGTNLVIVRHGESAAQVGGILSGHDTCTGLSDLGRRQVATLRDRLLRTGELGAVHGVYTSILPRAIETAEIIRPALGAVIATADCEWCEIHAGEAEGMTYDEMREKYPLVPDTGAWEPFVPRFPGGESWAQCFARVGRQLRTLAYQHAGERVVVVGHGGTVGASFVALGDAPIRTGIDMTHAAVNSSLTEWRYSHGAWRLVRFNDAGHLADLQS
jgi:probable phosphoglycerate mutase